MGFPIVLVMLVIVIVIAMPVLMSMLNAIEVFVHMEVCLILIVVGAHHQSFRYFASAALSWSRATTEVAGLKGKRALVAHGVRLRDVPFLLIAPLGLFAALTALVLLQAIAHLALGRQGLLCTNTGR